MAIATFMSVDEFGLFMNNEHFKNDRFGLGTIYDKLFKKLNISGFILWGFSTIPVYKYKMSELFYFGINKDDDILIIFNNSKEINTHNYYNWSDYIFYERHVKNNPDQHYSYLENSLELCVRGDLNGCEDMYQTLHKSTYNEIIDIVDLKGLSEEMKDDTIKRVLTKHYILK